MISLGAVVAGSTIYVPFATHDTKGAAGNRAADGSIRIYKNGSDTQRTSSSGITDTDAFDGVTGISLLAIDLTDNTDAGFYAAGNRYHVMLIGATIAGQTVNTWLATFEIVASASAGLDAAGVRAAIGLASPNLDTQLGTIDDFLDTEIGAIKAKTDLLPAVPAATTDIPSAATIADAVWDEVLTGATHNVPTSAGVRLRNVSGGIVTAGTAQAGTVNSITLASSASSVDGTYDPGAVRLVGGAGAGQVRLILHYVGSTRVATVDRDWRTAPNNTSEYEIIAAPNLLSTNEGLAQGGTSSTITLNTNAAAADDTYKGQTCVLRTGTGQDQSRLIASYVGATKVATVVSPWTTTPDSGSAYMILPTGRAMVVTAEAGSITGASFATDAITATALAASAVAELQAGLAMADEVPTAAALADAVWDELIAGHAAAGSTGEALSAAGAGSGGASAADIADAVWDEARAGHVAMGSSGEALEAILQDTAALQARVPADPAAASDIPSADSLADALLDRADGIEMALTLREALRLVVAASAGKVAGAATTTVTIRNFGDTKDRITATVDDVGNRTAVLTDLT